MIKIYKFVAMENINDQRLRVSQKYRFTENKEYIGRCTGFNTMMIYDDIGNGIEFDIPMSCCFRMNQLYSGVFDMVDSLEVENKKELRKEIMKTINKER